MVPQPRLITVSGDAEVKTAPDQVIFTLGLSSTDKDLATAKLKNNERVKGVLAVARQLGIAAKDVQSGYVSINAEYWYNRKNASVSRTVVVTLRNLARYDEALTRLVQNNRANSVQGIEFRTSQLKKYREQARILAIQAAREKAVSLAGALGATIGKPYSIREDAPGEYYGGYGSYGSRMMNVSQTSLASSNAAYSSGGTLAPGQIPVTARVSVSFDLQ